MNTIALAFLMLFASAPALAAQGECGQPVSNGSQPTASDCLFILRAAVGSAACSPECVCDTNGSGTTTPSDALLCLMKAVGRAVDLTCSTCGFHHPVPVGGEVQINTHTTGDQRRPSVAADAEGNLIVAWESNWSSGSDADASSIQAQRFLSTGQPVGTQFEVNTFTTSQQLSVSLAATADGAFVLVWSNYGGSPSDTSKSVRARLFDSSGMAVGDDFQVNSYTTGSQIAPSVGMDGAGNFVVVWQSTGSSFSDVSSYSIHGQRFDSSGATVGTEFQINTYTTDAQTAPAIAVASSGQFVVVWANDPDANAIRGQRFDENGAALGTEFTVNTNKFGDQTAPDVGILADGGFVVAWNGNNDPSFGEYASIQAQRFDSDGTPAGREFEVNTYTSGSQVEPSVASLASGAFVVVWEHWGYFPSHDRKISGRLFDTDGRPFGAQFDVTVDSTFHKVFADAALGANNGFAVVWESYGSILFPDSSGLGIRGRRFE